jgi:hypothetical protein
MCTPAFLQAYQTSQASHLSPQARYTFLAILAISLNPFVPCTYLSHPNVGMSSHVSPRSLSALPLLRLRAAPSHAHPCQAVKRPTLSLARPCVTLIILSFYATGLQIPACATPSVAASSVCSARHPWLPAFVVCLSLHLCLRAPRCRGLLRE